MLTATQQQPSLLQGLRVQVNVIGALILREIVIRWGRRNLGFAWLFAEPLVFAFPVLTIWSMVRPPYEHGLPMMPFIWTGYVAILLFRHVTGMCINMFKANAAVLFHRRVTPLDMFIARAGTEALGNLGSIFFSFVVFYELGLLEMPHDYTLVLGGFLFTAWWSMAIAMVVGALSERSEYVAHVWTPIAYLYIFYSGFIFMADWLPENLRNIAMWVDPPLHCYEMIRGGYFGNQVPTYYDPWYLTEMLLVLSCLGLWLVHHLRKHLEFE